MHHGMDNVEPLVLTTCTNNYINHLSSNMYECNLRCATSHKSKLSNETLSLTACVWLLCARTVCRITILFTFFVLGPNRGVNRH